MNEKINQQEIFTIKVSPKIGLIAGKKILYTEAKKLFALKQFLTLTCLSTICTTRCNPVWHHLDTFDSSVVQRARRLMSEKLAAARPNLNTS